MEKVNSKEVAGDLMALLGLAIGMCLLLMVGVGLLSNKLYQSSPMTICVEAVALLQ